MSKKAWEQYDETQLKQLEALAKDRKTIAADLEKLKTICNSGDALKWTVFRYRQNRAGMHP